MHKNKDFGIISLYSLNWEGVNENVCVEAEFSQCCSSARLMEVLSCQQGALRSGPLSGGRRRVWLGTDNPQGNDDRVLHSTNRTIQTMLMKCLRSCTLLTSSPLCCFISLTAVQSFSPRRFTRCSLLSPASFRSC